MAKRDMISELPKDLMDNVLERMPIQDAIRTSIWSRRWRYKWTSIRNLTFGTIFFDFIVYEKSFPYHVYFDIIEDLLENYHDGNIDSFTLYVPDSDTEVLSALIPILFLVKSKGVKQLTIYYETPLMIHKADYYMNLTMLFHCSNLTHLRLTNCGISQPPVFNGFPNLVFLHCSSVTFSRGSFAYMFSRCPLIESLSLLHCSSPDTFDICSTSLKYLNVSVASESKINISALNLERLYVCPREYKEDLNPRPVGFKTMLNSLKDLCFHCIYFQYFDDVSLFLNLLRAAPNLQVLDVTTDPGLHEKEVINILKTMNKKMEKLETVNVHIWAGADEMCLVELLLNLTPSLKRMQVELSDVSDKAAIIDEIGGYRMASPLAVIDYRVVTPDANEVNLFG